MPFVPGQARHSPDPAAARATIAFAAFAVGQVAAIECWRRGISAPAAGWFGVALMVLAGAAAWRGRPPVAALAISIALLSGGWFTARVLEVPASGLAALLGREPAPGAGTVVTLDGVVLDAPQQTREVGALAGFLPRESSWSFGLGVRAAAVAQGEAPVDGVVRVFVRGGAVGVSPGERLRVTGIARAIGPAQNPGESDARLWAAQEDLAANVSVASPALLEPAPGRSTLAMRLEGSWLRARGWLRSRAAVILGEDSGSESRAMLGALLLGERDSGTSDLQAVFARQGLAHVLAISGFHLAVMAGAALFAVRLTGDRGWLEPLAVGVLVVLYMTLLPARAPILRAGAIVLVWLVSESMGRRYDRRALLAWIAIGVLVVRPMDLFALGYQLTFGVTAALVWWGARVHERMFPARLEFERREPPDALDRRWWTSGATRLISASVLCWVVATPLVARSVGIVSPGAVLATIVVTPLVTVLLWAGYLAMVVGMLVPGAAGAVGSVLDVLSVSVVWLVRLFDKVPGSTLSLPQISIALTAALTVLGAVWLVRGLWRSPGLWAATILAMGWLVGELANAGRLPPRAAFRIDTLDVGDGTCHLLRSRGEAMLWDCGSLRASIGTRTIPRALRELGVWRTPRVVLSHPNFDHYSGLLDVAGPLGVRSVLVPRAFFDRAERDPGGAAAVLLQRLDARGIVVEELAAGETLALGGARLDVRSPQRGARFGGDNDHSLVAAVRVPTRSGERTLLLCGDIQREAMASLMSPGVDLRADVMELPHHGSVHATALGFVSAVDPGVVLQSTGPSRATAIGWNELRAGRDWLTTAVDGAAWVEFAVDGAIRTGSIRRGE